MNKAKFKRLKAAAFKRGKIPPLSWTFAVGLGWVRIVTVRASGIERALNLAQRKCDALDAKAGRESPVSHTLYLIDVHWKEKGTSNAL